jgi:cell division protein FtsL
MSSRPHRLPIYIAPSEDRYMVQSVDTAFLRRLLFILVVVVPVVLMVLLIIQANNQVTALGRQIRYLEFQQKKLEDERIALRLEREKLLKPDRVVEQARARGLEPLTPEQVRRIYVP